MSELAPDGITWNPKNYKNLIINVAVTGAVPSKAEFPELPTSPTEIAESVLECASLGAQVFHIHMRDESGNPTQDIERYRETIERIRDKNTDLLICVTTSSRVSLDFRDRLTPLMLESPNRADLASLSLGSFNFPKAVSRNPLEEIVQLADFMHSAGIKPELEVFEPGMATTANLLKAKGVLKGPLVMNILLGNYGTSNLTAQSLSSFLGQLDDSTEWALAGIGRFQRKSIMLGVALGGNVRVGLEDDPVGDGSGLWSNSKAVSLAIEAAKLANRSLASCHEVRERFAINS